MCMSCSCSCSHVHTFSPSRQQDAVFLFFSCFTFLFPPSNITCFLFLDFGRTRVANIPPPPPPPARPTREFTVYVAAMMKPRHSDLICASHTARSGHGVRFPPPGVANTRKLVTIVLDLQNRVFNYRRKTTDTIKHTEAENMTSHFAARMSRGRGSRLVELRLGIRRIFCYGFRRFLVGQEREVVVVP
jgi:hypothetical protein